jgi:caa(3)-type oxidase subunit IV
MEQTRDIAEPTEERRRPNYLLVFLGLGLLTLAEVGVTYLPIIKLPILLALTSTKVVLVAMFYMHLKTDSKWYAYLFLVPLPFAVLIVGSLLVGGY